MKPTKKTALGYFTAAALVLAIDAQTVPQMMNYQGRLTDAQGQALPTADYSLSVSIYDAAQGGNRVWGPQIFDGSTATGHGAKVPVVQGHFNVVLGPSDTGNTSIASTFNGIRWIEVTVGSNPPILPRQQILTTPFAFAAQNAQTAALATNAVSAQNSAKLNGYDWSAILADGALNPATGRVAESRFPVGVAVPVGGVISWWGAPNALPEGWELCDGGNVQTADAVLKGAKPNLVERFPRGASAAAGDLSKTPRTGGSASFSGSTLGHSLTIGEMPNHAHGGLTRGIEPFTGSDSGRDYNHFPTGRNGYGINYTAYPNAENRLSEHQHGINAEGGNQAHAHALPTIPTVPPYLELYYIIRVK